MVCTLFLHLDNQIPARQERRPGEVRMKRAKGKQVQPETDADTSAGPHLIKRPRPSPKGQIHLVGGRKDMDEQMSMNLTEALLRAILELIEKCDTLEELRESVNRIMNGQGK